MVEEKIEEGLIGPPQVGGEFYLEVDAYTHFELARIFAAVAARLGSVLLCHRSPNAQIVNVQGRICRLEVIQEVGEQGIEGEAYIPLCI